MHIKRFLNKNVLSVFALVVCLCIYFVVALVKINSLANEHCFSILRDASNQVTAEIKILVRIAESKMFEAKREYYEKGGNVAKARLMNQKLEQILLEKKDAETFLETISSRFMGVVYSGYGYGHCPGNI